MYGNMKHTEELMVVLSGAVLIVVGVYSWPLGIPLVAMGILIQFFAMYIHQKYGRI